MTRLPRRARAVLRLVAPCVFGIAAGGYVIHALLAQDWILALWAGLTALWTFLYAAHSCPPPPAPAEPTPPSRGVQCVHFIGGAQDGGQGIVATDGRDLDQAVLSIDGTDYRVTSVRTTCYTAEADA